METIWEKVDYLSRILCCIIMGIAYILIMIAPLYASRHEQSGQRSDENKNYTMEEFISRIIDFMKSEYGDFLMIVMCLVFVVFIVTIFNNKTPE